MSLIKTIDQLRKHLPVSVSLSLENMAPYILDAEQAVIIPFVSEELYSRVSGKFQADTPEMAPKEAELLEKMQLVAVRFALSEYIPAGEVIIGDDGITTVGKGTSRTAAYDRQIVRLLESTIRQAWNALDRLLVWLEKNASEFSEYTGSEQYTRYRRGLVRDTRTFNDIYYIASSRLTFQAVHPELLNVEEDRLIPLITKEHYDIIHSNASLSELYTRLLSVSRKAVIFQAAANVIQLQQNVSLDAGTLRVYGTTNSAGDNVQYYQKPSTADRKDAAAKAQARADMYFDSLAEILCKIQGDDQVDFQAGIMGDEIVML